MFIVTHVDGRDIRLCGTCQPRPPESIVGYLRKDGGVTVHQKGCHTLRPERMSRRMLKLGWGEAAPRQARLINVRIEVYDRPGLLFEITHLIQDEQINISYIHTPEPEREGEVILHLTLEIIRPRQLVRILHQIQALSNVFSVQSFPDTVRFDEYQPAESFYRPE